MTENLRVLIIEAGTTNTQLRNYLRYHNEPPHRLTPDALRNFKLRVRLLHAKGTALNVGNGLRDSLCADLKPQDLHSAIELALQAAMHSDGDGSVESRRSYVVQANNRLLQTML